jgi:8-oxo-dGTP pyrophosphatase MutT (NUDIX family)
MSFLDRIHECNEHDLKNFRPLYVAGHRVGWVQHAMATRLAQYPDVFEVEENTVALSPRFDSFEARSAAVRTVLEQLRDAGVIPGWRDEPYPVATTYGAPPLLQMERAAFPSLGMRAYGVHMNGFVQGGSGIKMWVARRAYDKPTFPGLLDNMVAGGLPIGISLRENVIKECGEEAGIVPDIAARATFVSAISYCKEVQEGLKPDVQFVCDLELPPGFEPRAVDGEVDEFYLWSIDRVMETVANTTEFKFNCNLVIIDFLVRRGFISPEQPDYLEIVAGLRQ